MSKLAKGHLVPWRTRRISRVRSALHRIASEGPHPEGLRKYWKLVGIARRKGEPTDVNWTLISMIGVAKYMEQGLLNSVVEEVLATPEAHNSEVPYFAAAHLRDSGQLEHATRFIEFGLEHPWEEEFLWPGHHYLLQLKSLGLNTALAQRKDLESILPLLQEWSELRKDKGSTEPRFTETIEFLIERGLMSPEQGKIEVSQFLEERERLNAESRAKKPKHPAKS